MWKQILLMLRNPGSRKFVLQITFMGIAVVACGFLQLPPSRSIVDVVFASLFAAFLCGSFVAWCMVVFIRKRARLELLYGSTVISTSLLCALVLAFAKIYTYFGIIDQKGEITRDVWSCLYFSIVTWTTLGFGDFVPTVGARIFVAAEALAGYVTMGLFISLFVSLASMVKEEAE